MNHEDTFVQFMFNLPPSLTVRTDVRSLRLSSKQDLWYLGGGAFQRDTFGSVGRPSGGSKSLGTLLDVSADYALTPSTTMTVYLAGVHGRKVPGSIYPSGSNSHYFFFEFTKKF